MAPSTIGEGKKEVRAIEDQGATPLLEPLRSRRAGAGRKKTTDKDPTLLSDPRLCEEVLRA